MRRQVGKRFGKRPRIEPVNNQVDGCEDHQEERGAQNEALDGKNFRVPGSQDSFDFLLDEPDVERDAREKEHPRNEDALVDVFRHEAV